VFQSVPFVSILPFLGPPPTGGVFGPSDANSALHVFDHFEGSDSFSWILFSKSYLKKGNPLPLPRDRRFSLSSAKHVYLLVSPCRNNAGPGRHRAGCFLSKCRTFSKIFSIFSSPFKIYLSFFSPSLLGSERLLLFLDVRKSRFVMRWTTMRADFRISTKLFSSIPLLRIPEKQFDFTPYPRENPVPPFPPFHDRMTILAPSSPFRLSSYGLPFPVEIQRKTPLYPPYGTYKPVDLNS